MPFVYIMSQVNPVYTLPTSFFKIHSNIIFPSYLALWRTWYGTVHLGVYVLCEIWEVV